MNNNKIIYKNTIQKRYLNPLFNKRLNKKFLSIFNNLKINLDAPQNTLNSLSKKFRFNFKVNDLYKFKKFKTIVIVGMGGSILGSEALYYFLKKKAKKNLLFLDNINENKLNELKTQYNLKNILFIVISKSGHTIETLSNFFALRIVKKNSKNIIIISEKSNNPLYSLSKKMKLHHIEHKNFTIGRYSVLSEVGMVPAHLIGVNLLKFRKNLLNHFKAKNKEFLKKSSIALANILKKNRLNNLVFLNYVPELEKFLYWLQQLIAESLGKDGKGFLPLISNAPKDHHSLLQLYLDGPKDKIFYIFSNKIKNDNKIKINEFDKDINFLNNKSLGLIKDAQKNSFIKVLKEKSIPFREFQIKDFEEDTLGELFSYFMLETVITGKLANINPFNQPAVEKVKVYTKNSLT